jgi:hypothetical protein
LLPVGTNGSDETGGFEGLGFCVVVVVGFLLGVGCGLFVVDDGIIAFCSSSSSSSSLFSSSVFSSSALESAQLTFCFQSQ